MTSAASLATGAVAAVTGAITSALSTSKSSTTSKQNSAGQTKTSSTKQTSTQTTAKTPSTITSVQTANETPLSSLLKTNTETGKTTLQNYRNATAERRSEAKAANTKAAQNFVSYIDEGYESEKITDNLRSLALEILLPTTLIRNEVEKEAGTYNAKDPIRAVETVADTIALIPVAGGIVGGASKVLGKGAAATKSITSGVNMASKLTALKKVASKLTGKTSGKTTSTKAKTTATTSKAKTSGKTTSTKAKTKATTSKAKTSATTSKAKTTAKATSSSTTGSKALTALKATSAVGSTALTGLFAYSLVDELINPADEGTTQTNPAIPEEDYFIDDTGLYDTGAGTSTDTGLYDTGLGGAYNVAEQTAEEILDPLSEVPVVGDAITTAAENGLSLPLLIGIIATAGAVAYFAYKKTAKKNRSGKTTRKKSPKHKAKGAAA